MRLLPYCITETEPQIEIPKCGVQGMPIETIVESGLRCLVSRYREIATGGEQSVHETGVAFNRVLQQIFRQVAIVPFRFPIILADDAELSAFLREHGDEYARALPRLRDKVQVEVRISYQRAPESQQGAVQSGLDYMRKQHAQLHVLESTVSALKAAGQPFIDAWRERPVLSGMRCYALVARPAMEKLIECLGSVEIVPEITARVTGPWPATEFLREQ